MATVKVKKSGKIVAFITAIPLHIIVEGKQTKMAEVNFLCVHKKLRSHRLAPVLIKEITRRVNLRDIWQAVNLNLLMLILGIHCWYSYTNPYKRSKISSPLSEYQKTD